MKLPTALVLAASLAACGGSGDDSGQVRIGLLAPLSGDLALSGRDLRDTAQLAIDEINASGGLLGRDAVLDVEDDASSPNGAVSGYTRLLAGGVAAVIGPSHSPGVRALEATIKASRTLTISGSATASGLGALDDDGYFFRTVPSDTVQSTVLAAKIMEQGCQHICLVHRRDAYGDSLSDAVVAALTAGSNPEIIDAGYDPAMSLDGVVAGCESIRGVEAAGALFITYQGDGRDLLDQAVKLGWNTTQHHIFLADGNRRQGLYDALAERGSLDELEGAIGTAPSGPDPSTPAGARDQAFQERYMAAYDHAASTFSESHYDATYLAAIAIELAGALDDRAAVRDAIARSSTGTAVDAGDWNRMRATIAASGEIDYQGASGDVTLDAATGELEPPYYIQIWSIVEGRVTSQSIETVTTRPPSLRRAP